MEWTANTLPQGRMPDDILSRLLQEIAENRSAVVSVEPYLNNEPFLDKRFVDVLRRIRSSLSCNIEVSTNASHLSENISGILLAERLIDDLRLSVFGASRSTYESVMVGLDWDTVVSNIHTYVKLWNKAGKPNKTRIVFVDNAKLFSPDEAQKVRDLWLPLGLDVTVWGHLDRAGNNLILLNQNGRPNRRATVVNCKMGYMKNRVAIMYDGDVLLCCQDWSREVVIGNIGQRSLREIWDSEERKKYLSLIYDASVSNSDLLCLRCELATIQDH